jgi:hypothetical protein
MKRDFAEEFYLSFVEKIVDIFSKAESIYRDALVKKCENLIDDIKKKATYNKLVNLVDDPEFDVELVEEYTDDIDLFILHDSLPEMENIKGVIRHIYIEFNKSKGKISRFMYYVSLDDDEIEDVWQDEELELQSLSIEDLRFLSDYLTKIKNKL